ncbi:MAG: putative lipid II flippase FtsW [Chitinispirillaceae bacterium]|nr:putative lipid II flippase FtsW [Chitinispirillaceae bacterium]
MRRQATMDWPLFTAILFMLGCGIVLVYSSSFALAQVKYGGSDFFLVRQTVRALLAVACFMVCINVDYHHWARWSGIAYLGAVALLVALLVLPESHTINGARRWLNLGPFQVQVSDFARMALVVFLAKRCEYLGAGLRDVRVLLKQFGLVGCICGLILLEPDFSTAMVIGLIAAAILFIGGARFWHLTALLFSALPLVALLVLKTPYRRARLTGFMDTIGTRDGLGYQLYQSLVGLGNGGLFGAGLGKGEQKFFYLPEPHTDFVFSILGEEIGFVGILLVLSVLGFIVFRGMRVALAAHDRMGQIMAFGFTFTVALYALMHASVACGLIPVTGLPMPFLSYGGMSLLFTMCSMGIVLNISNQTNTRVAAKEGKQQ